MAEKTLIYAPNWLGDDVMSMPALQLLKRRQPEGRLSVLVKKELAPLWRMHASVDEVIELQGGWSGTREGARHIEAHGFRKAVVFPNSFRSALIPYMAHVPARCGLAGDHRRWLLTDIVTLPESQRERHQAWEYVHILGLSDPEELEPPALAISDAMVAQCRDRLSAVDAGGGWIGLIPGAAHGPSKQWPPEHFGDVGRRLIRAIKCRVLVFGTAAETDLCARVAGGIGGGATNMAGATSLRELAALLRLCRAVVANDSGGMHLAAAARARVVAVFGLTDPAKTGPLGAGHKVVFNENVSGSRDIKPRSADAERCLRDIDPERVAAAALEIVSGGG